MTELGKTRMAGVVLTLIGIGGVAYTWYSAFVKGYYYDFVSFVAILFVCLGLSMALIPFSKPELEEKYNTSQIGLKEIPLVQKIAFAIGIILALVQYAFFQGYI